MLTVRCNVVGCWMFDVVMICVSQWMCICVDHNRDSTFGVITSLAQHMNDASSSSVNKSGTDTDTNIAASSSSPSLPSCMASYNRLLYDLLLRL